MRTSLTIWYVITLLFRLEQIVPDDLLETLHGRPAAKSAVFAACLGA